MSLLGHFETSPRKITKSASRPRADIISPARRVRKVPFPDSCATAGAAYSITSSALASSAVGMLRPSALAVLRLMINSNLVGACTEDRQAFHREECDQHT